MPKQWRQIRVKVSVCFRRRRSLGQRVIAIRKSLGSRTILLPALLGGKRCELDSCTSSSNDRHIRKFHNMFGSQYRGWVQYRLRILFGAILLILFFGLLPKSSTGREGVRTFVIPSKTHPRQAAANATLGVSLLPDQSNLAARLIPYSHGEHC